MLCTVRTILIACHAARRRSAGLFIFLALAAAAPFHPEAVAQDEPTYADSILVHSMSFVGNRAFDSEELRSHMATRIAPGSIAIFLNSISERLPFAGAPQYFDAETYRQDIDALTLLYRNNGFFDVQIDGTYTLDRADRKADLLVTIAEGAPWPVDSIEYRHIGHLPADLRAEIFAQPVLRRGERYTAEHVEAEIERIRGLLGNSGYPLAYADSVVVMRMQSTHTVRIVLPFVTGNRLRIGDVRRTIRGADELNLAQKIIDDRLEFQKGDIYSNEKRDRSETNLTRLNIFSSVRISALFPPITDTQRTLVPMTVILEPKNRHELAPGVLVNSLYNRLNAGAEISYLLRNVFGGAQTLTTRVNVLSKVDLPINDYQAVAQIRLDQPYLIDNSTSAYWSIAYILAHESGFYGGNILQSIIGLRRFFTDRLVGSVEWTLEQSKYDLVASGKSLVNTPFAPFDTTGIDYRNSIITLSLEHDVTNDFFNPTAGYSLKGIVEEAGLLKHALPAFFSGYQTAEYRKAEGLFRVFTDVSRNRTAIVAFKLRAGGIFRYGESLARDIPVPFNRRYYAGGTQSIRAWGARGLAAGGPVLASFGGNALVESSLEYRWQPFPRSRPWLFLEPEKVWFVVFTDAGNLWPEPRSIRVSEFAAAFGVGLRYNLFFGPIRIDYGMRMYDPLASPNRWFFERSFWSEVAAKGQIQLGIGHAF